MSVSVSGPAGDLRITFCACIEDQEGQRMVELDFLEHEAHERLLRLLLEDPTLVDRLANLETDDSPSMRPHGETDDCPSGDVAGGLHHPAEAAPRRPRQRSKAQRGGPPSDQSNDTRSNGAPRQPHHARSTDEASTVAQPDPVDTPETDNQETQVSTQHLASTQSPSDSTSNVNPGPESHQSDKSPLYPSKEGFARISKGKRAKPAKKQRLSFMPTPRSELPEFACVNFGHRFLQAAQPEGRDSLSPGPCNGCAGCIGAKRYEKMEQYEASKPSPISTVLEYQFPTFIEANEFAQLREHAKRISHARRCTLFTALQQYRFGLPWVVRMIWDGPASDEVKDDIEHHAKNAGAENVSVTVGPLSPQQFLDWVPYRFSMPKTGGGFYNLCRFSNGWAQKQKAPSDHRSGRKRMIQTDKSGQPKPEPVLIERAQAIANSWKGLYRQSQSKFLLPERRQELAEEFQRALDRARYVAIMDWVQRWEMLQPEHIDLSRKFVDSYLCGQKPSDTEWQEATDGPKALVVETARWLNGERGPEPYITMVADRLGYIMRWGKPDIDTHYLTELTHTLPPLVFDDALYDTDGSFDDDLFGDYEEMAA